MFSFLFGCIFKTFCWVAETIAGAALEIILF